MRRVDRAFAGLLLCVLLVGVASALSTPITTQLDYGVDERWHLAIIQTLAEHGKLPERRWAPPTADPRSTEQRLAERGSGVAEPRIAERVHPLWTAAVERRWREADARLGEGAREDGSGPSPVRHIPPGYALVVAGPYAIAPGSWMDRALLVRLLSVLMAMVTTALAWQLARVAGLPRLGALLCAGVVGLNPHSVQLAGFVNPDNLVLPLWTAALLGGTLLLLRGLTWPRLLAFALPVLALPLVKQTGVVMLPAALFVVAVAVRRRYGARGLVTVLAAAGVLALALGVLLATKTVRYIVEEPEPLWELPGFLLQFYTPFARPFAFMPRWEVTRLIAVHRDVAASLAPAVLTLLTLGAGAWLFRLRASVQRALLAFYGLTAVGLVAGMHWVGYLQAVENHRVFDQPRYFLPLVPLAGLVLGAAAARLPERMRAPAVAVVLALCAGGSVAWVLTRAEIGYA